MAVQDQASKYGNNLASLHQLLQLPSLIECFLHLLLVFLLVSVQTHNQCVCTPCSHHNVLLPHPPHLPPYWAHRVTLHSLCLLSIIGHLLALIKPLILQTLTGYLIIVQPSVATRYQTTIHHHQDFPIELQHHHHHLTDIICIERNELTNIK